MAIAASGLLAVAVALTGAGSAGARSGLSVDSGDPEAIPFTQPGTNELYHVPSFDQNDEKGVVWEAHVEVVGATGGTASGDPEDFLQEGTDVEATLLVKTGSYLRIIVGRNGTQGDPKEVAPAPGGWPGGGVGLDGGGGGGGYSAICSGAFDPNSGTPPTANCSVVAGGGGGDGGQPAHAPASDPWPGTGGGVEGHGRNGAAEGTAGPGLGAQDSAPGAGGNAGSGDGAMPGQPGTEGTPGQGGDGGFGPTGGGGGGGGGGVNGGGGGGGGGSCPKTCQDGYSGGGGGDGGSSDPSTHVPGTKPMVIMLLTPVIAPTDNGEGGPTLITSAEASLGTIGQPASASALSLPLSCVAPPETSCQLTISASASPGAQTASAAGSATAVRSATAAKHRTVLVARAAITLADGQTQTLKLRLDGAGVALLRKSAKVPVTVTVTGTHGKAITRKLTLKGHRVR